MEVNCSYVFGKDRQRAVGHLGYTLHTCSAHEEENACVVQVAGERSLMCMLVENQQCGFGERSHMCELGWERY